MLEPKGQNPWTGHQSTYVRNDSDFEDRYEVEGRDRRKLVVVNAEVMASSSSEGEESDHGIGDENWEMEGNHERGEQTEISHNQTGIVGLGLGLEGFNTRREDANKHDLEINADWQNPQAPRVQHGFQTPTLSILSSLSSAPDYSSRRDPVLPHDSGGAGVVSGVDSGPSDSMRRVEEERQRRRDALIGIVSGLELTGSRNGPLASGEMEESDYGGEDGLAISGSVGVGEGQSAENGGHGITIEISKEDESESEYEDEESEPEVEYNRSRQQQTYEEPPQGRNKQSRAVPTSQVSGQSDDGGRIVAPESHAVSSNPRFLLHRPGSFMYRSPSPSRPPSAASYSSPVSYQTKDNCGRKSPLRSPVVRGQSDRDTAPPMPAALRRHSVYHQEPSPVRGLSSNSSIMDHPGSRAMSQDQGLGITQRSNASVAAARERKALGIPPSESDEVYQNEAHRQSRLSHAESNLSTIGSNAAQWRQQVADGEDEEWSMGAETLFRTLSGKEQMGNGGEGEQVGAERSRMGRTSQRSSASSVYEEDQGGGERWWQQDASAEHHQELHGPNSEVLQNGKDSSLVDRGEGVEMKRQEIIQELYETEAAFVKRLRVAVQVFILPLRIQNSKAWVSGVPSDVARLLDWLEDIANLHTQILSSLKSARAAAQQGLQPHGTIERFTESMRTFVPRLEVYQPYLVRLADIAGLIGRLMEDERSDFGEFARIQEREGQCDGWSLEKFLVEPVNRLAKYPDLFAVSARVLRSFWKLMGG